MKRIFHAILFLILWTGIASAQTLIPIPLSGEWSNANGFSFSPTCSAPHYQAHGVSCVYFPAGAQLDAYQFQTSIKTGGIEALWILAYSKDGTMNGATIIVQNHHQSSTPVVAKQLALPKPIQIPAGSYVWIYGEAFGVTDSPVVETQSTIYVEASAYRMIPPTASRLRPSPPSQSPAPPTTKSGTQSPKGSLDVIRSNGIARGWSYDPDVSGDSIRVDCYADGPAGTGSLAASGTTDLMRTDVNQAINISGLHGFELQLPISTKGHQIWCYGIDATGNPNILVDGSPKVYP